MKTSARLSAKISLVTLALAALMAGVRAEPAPRTDRLYVVGLPALAEGDTVAPAAREPAEATGEVGYMIMPEGAGDLVAGGPAATTTEVEATVAATDAATTVDAKS